jgi:protein phosphatase
LARTFALAILHPGYVRPFNEDNLYMLDQDAQTAPSQPFEKSTVSSGRPQLYAVADGSGGLGVGDAASRAAMAALDQMRRSLRPGPFNFENFARETINQANRAVSSQLAAYEGLQVGATFTLLAIDRHTAYTVSLGNSRIYLYRGGQLRRLTEDHLSRLPNHHPLSRHIGFLTDAALTESDNMTRTDIQAGDIFLLTTDGVTANLGDAAIARVLSEPGAFVQTVQQLRDQVLQSGGQDNFALLAVKIQDPAAAAPAKPKTRPARRSSVPADARSAGPYLGPPVRSHGAIGDGATSPRWLKPLLFFLIFILLGIALGKIIFSLPDLIGRLLDLG